MSDERKRPYYDPNQRQVERAVIVAPESPCRDFVTLVYNWLTQRYEPYHGKSQPTKKP